MERSDAAILQAELVGTEAAAQLPVREASHKRRHICSDSMAAFRALKNMTMVSNLPVDCYSTLNTPPPNN